MSYSYYYAEKIIEKVLNIHKNNNYMSSRSAVIDFDLKPYYLQNYAKEVSFKSIQLQICYEFLYSDVYNI